MKYIVYNPMSDNSNGERLMMDFAKNLVGEKEYIDVTSIDVVEFYRRLKKKDEVILCGGDGTLHRFVNSLYGEPHLTKVYFVPMGSGNDFARDVKEDFEYGMVEITPYLDSLPEVILVKKESAEAKEHTLETRHFMNNVAFGLDGYCCEKSDEIKEKKSGKVKINYTLIALSGILGGYKNTNAIVKVDGVQKEYTNVLMAPTMNGRFYGGGVMIAPMQDRKNLTGELTLVVAHSLSIPKILRILPLTYSGKHVKYTENVDILRGMNISVEFDRPSPVQVDGETVKNVIRYEVKSSGVGPLFL